MPTDRDRQLAEHMLTYARAGLGIAAGESRASLEDDVRLQFSLCYALQVIGEAAAHLSKDCRARLATIPWRRVVGMRHRMVHGYENVDLSVVWDTVHDDLPILIRELERFLAREPGNGAPQEQA